MTCYDLMKGCYDVMMSCDDMMTCHVMHVILTTCHVMSCRHAGFYREIFTRGDKIEHQNILEGNNTMCKGVLYFPITVMYRFEFLGHPR